MEEHIRKGNYSTEVEKYNNSKEKELQKSQNKHSEGPIKDIDSKINMESRASVNKTPLKLEDLKVEKGN